MSETEDLLGPSTAKNRRRRKLLLPDRLFLLSLFCIQEELELEVAEFDSVTLVAMRTAIDQRTVIRKSELKS